MLKKNEGDFSFADQQTDNHSASCWAEMSNICKRLKFSDVAASSVRFDFGTVVF